MREVVGILGTRLDQGRKPNRWERWRPTVALCQCEDYVVDRLTLLVSRTDQELAQLVRDDIETVSPETKVELRELSIDDPWDFEQTYSALHDFSREYQSSSEAAELLVHITTGTHVAQICLFLLTESRHLAGKLLQTSPTPGGPNTSAGSYRVIDLDLSKYDRLASRFALEQEEGVRYLKSGITTSSVPFNQLIERIDQVAMSSEAPILLTGPTGAGKTLLARRIYELKRRRHRIEGPFVEVNCATLRGDQAMSALFGHIAGAFTGATGDRGGLLRAAHGGMLFLDEIGELGLDEQAMLLRAIEDGRFMPLGADREQESQFHLIAGTNRDLTESVRVGGFREDLLARINLWTFSLPGLAERREDIEANLDYELQRYSDRTGTRVSIAKEARQKFLRFAESSEATWNANFRDLGAAVTRMSTLARGGRITVALVDEEKGRLLKSWADGGSAPERADILDQYFDSNRLGEIDQFDQAQLAEVLRVCRRSSTLSDAGRRLFDASRLKKKSNNDADRLRKYLARFDLTWERVGASGESRSSRS